MDFDPDLGKVARHRWGFAQAHAAASDQREAVETLVLNLDDERRLLLNRAVEFLPGVALLGVPQFHRRDARGADILDFIIEVDALAVYHANGRASRRRPPLIERDYGGRGLDR